MRALSALALAAVVALPSSAGAKTWRGPGRRGAPAARAAPTGVPFAVRPSPGAAPVVAGATASTYPTAPAPRYGAPRSPYRYPTAPVAPLAVYPVAPLWWWGWGWGFGYYPLYPRPSAEYAGYAGYTGYAGEPERIATTLSARAAGTRDGASAGIAIGIEGRRSGFDASVDALALDQVAGGHALGSSSAVGRGTAHVNWALVSGESARIRLELGGSMLSMPSGGTAAGAPWAGKVSFGPDVGISGALGLVGPVGVEGHARVTPLPVTVTDLRAAVALRAGALAFTGGWRAIHVAGDGVDAPSLRFSGPEVGLALIF